MDINGICLFNGHFNSMGVYQFSVAYFLVSTLLSKIFDVGDRDLPVLISGNGVIKGWVIKWPVKPQTFFTFLNVFSKSKKHDFLRFFEWLTTFSQTLAKTLVGSRKFIAIIVNSLLVGPLCMSNSVTNS